MNLVSRSDAVSVTFAILIDAVNPQRRTAVLVSERSLRVREGSLSGE
jgi:hypothetical protein